MSVWPSLTCCCLLYPSATPGAGPGWAKLMGVQSPPTPSTLTLSLCPSSSPMPFCSFSFGAWLSAFTCPYSPMCVAWGGGGRGPVTPLEPLWRVTSLQLSLYQSQNLMLPFKSRMCAGISATNNLKTVVHKVNHHVECQCSELENKGFL